MFREIPILAVLLAAAVSLAGCENKIEPGTTGEKSAKSVRVAVNTARVGTQPFVYEAVGTVVARTAGTLAGKLMGTVRAVHVREGDKVREGDLLVELDQRQVSANLDQARAAAELAQSTYERYQNLIKENSVSRQEFEEVEARHRQAQAALAAALVARKDAEVRAPYDGVITARMIDPGDMASPGTPFLAIEQEDAFCADLVLPESHIEAVSLDQQVQVSVAALGDAVLTGRVGRISPAADTRSRSFLVKVALPDDKRLKSGMFVRVAVPVGEAGMLMVPESAVVVHGQLSGVYNVDADSVARFRLIRTGRQYGNMVEVISGIAEGDRYVADPPPNLNDGDTVEVAP